MDGIDDDPAMDAQRATALGEKFLRLMNENLDGTPVTDDGPPMGWEESGVKIGAQVIDELLPSMAPILRDAMPALIGAYLGELLRRQHGGEWCVPPPDAGDRTAYVQFANGLPCHALAAVYRQIEGGPRHSIHSFYRIMSALGSLTGDEVMELAEGRFDFDKRFPDLAGAITVRPAAS